ncbi:MAG: acriflavin resistance protein, partial [Campylobacterota bacterium]|nr:acriflavin resistance protein [Campylobacterota bacterium]
LKVNAGDFVDIKIPSIKFNTRGRIKSIVPSANPMTHTFTIRVSFHKGQNKKIFPGMYAKIGIDYNDELLQK